MSRLVRVLVAVGVALCAAPRGASAGGEPSPHSHSHAASGAPTAYGGTGSDVARHPGDALKSSEHRALLALVPVERASDVAVADGRWSDPATWEGRRVPGSGARVWIRPDVEVSLERELDERAFRWIRVDGTLTFRPDVDTRLRVVTLVVGEPGRLEVGTAGRPIHPDRTAELRFVDRGPRDRAQDPFDLGGGLVGHGGLSVHGSPRDAHAVPREPLRAGVASLSFDAPPRHWRVGDRLLVPATDLRADRDELRTIVALSGDGRRVELDRPLEGDHTAPAGARVPVGNLTRNVVFRSENAADLGRRGHFMVMHTHEPVEIDGAAFVDLGRTDARRAHTIPDLDAEGHVVPGSDANTQGRYALHFHLRSGASRERPPHVVRRCAIVGSPKHGLVNHGGYVVAEDNVSFAIDGSHFFAENGTEIGRFSRNLAVRSRGSGDTVISREGVYDFGHQGHGFWSESGGVQMDGNWAFGHADAAFVVFSRRIEEGGRWVWLPPSLVEDPAVAEGRDRLDPGVVPFRFTGNTAAASRSGLGVWYNKVYARHDVYSRVEDSAFWALADHGIFLAYTRELSLRNVRLFGDPSSPSGTGIRTNDITDTLDVEGVRIEGFHVGVEVPPRGHNRIAHSRFDNAIDVWVGSPNRTGRRLELVDNRHGVLTSEALARSLPAPTPGWRIEAALRTLGILPERRQVRVWLAAPRVPGNGDLSVLFSSDPVIETRDGRTRRIWSLAQRPAAVPFSDTGDPRLDCVTSAEILETLGLAVGGALAPATAEAAPDVHGLVGPVTGLAAAEPLRPRSDPGPYGATFSVVDPEPGRAEWLIETRSLSGGERTLVAYRDSVPPTFHPSEAMRFEIHPDDVKYGFRVDGMLYDVVGTVTTKTAFSHDFRGLSVDADGFVRIPIVFEDDAGNVGRQTLEIRVTEDAVRRGTNTTYFLQDAYCQDCTSPGPLDRLWSLAQRVESWLPREPACESAPRQTEL